ncbi:DUF4147 domain-containing protein [Staphylococcus epidermidis]|nr:DUF4147 domain-containing protein [Staphylococcus epidermidis]
MACRCATVRSGGDPLRAYTAAPRRAAGAAGGGRGRSSCARRGRSGRCRAHSGADAGADGRRSGDLPDFGGSALLTLPAEGIDLAEKQRINKALLESGAAIGE